MDLAALSLALRAAELGSFAAAAREAGLDPSSASRAVGAVEDRLGVRLFQRTTRRLSLTEEGEAYLRRAAPLVEALEEARLEARAGRGRAAGRLRITASVAYGTRRLVPLLARFGEEAPDLEVELVLSDANLDLVAERVDLAVRLAPAPEGELISARLHAVRYRVVAAPSWVAAHGMPEAPEALEGVDGPRMALPGHRDAWRFRRGAEERRVAVAGRALMSNALALQAAAEAGLGPALLADWLVDGALGAGRLVELLPEWEVSAGTGGSAAWLLYPSRTYLPAKVRLGARLLREAATLAGAGGAG